MIDYLDSCRTVWEAESRAAGAMREALSMERG